MKELLDRLGIDQGVFASAVKADVAELWGPGAAFEVAEIPGGASIRGYARVKGDGRNMVLMVLSDPDPAKGVEEVMATGVIKELPFINVHRHLLNAGIAVPEIYRYNRERGLIYLEDLGGRHLRQYIDGGPDLRKTGFERAIRELVKIQVDASALKSDDFLGFLVKFDRPLLMWELNHFTEFAIVNRFPGALTASDAAAIDAHFEAITAELLAGPVALLHRDYHMDNLLLPADAVRVIDFQDALMGPLAYDLACLLYDRDTSAVLGRELIEHLVGFYADEYERRSGVPLDRKFFHRNFDLCVIHRMLKVVGRFHFIDQVKKRPEYLRFNPYMLPAIAEYLGRESQGKELLGTFCKYLPELEAVRKRN
jgi:N-acetylmuramate 1-kinase